MCVCELAHPFCWNIKTLQCREFLERRPLPNLIAGFIGTFSLERQSQTSETSTNSVELHPYKLTWHWKLPIFNRKYIFIHGGFSIVMLVFAGVPSPKRTASLHPENSETPRFGTEHFPNQTLFSGAKMIVLGFGYTLEDEHKKNSKLLRFGPEETCYHLNIES